MDNVQKYIETPIAKLKSNLLGTYFTLYDFGLKPLPIKKPLPNKIPKENPLATDETDDNQTNQNVTNKEEEEENEENSY